MRIWRYISKKIFEKRNLRQENIILREYIVDIASNHDLLVRTIKSLTYKFGDDNDNYHIFISKEQVEESLIISPVDELISIYNKEDGSLEVYFTDKNTETPLGN